MKTEVLQIYEMYPRKVKKPLALRAINKAINRDGFEKVRDGTREYAKRAIGRDLQFIPHPSTFFNQEMYNDDLNALLPNETRRSVNKRNEGVAGAGCTDYGQAAQRKLERQMAQTANPPSPAQGNGS